MSDGCCLYLVTFVPAGCTAFQEGDFVTGPCEAGCPDVTVNEPGPCDGLYLTSMSPDCIPCDQAAAGLPSSQEVKQRVAQRCDPAKARKVTMKELRAFRKVAASS